MKVFLTYEDNENKEYHKTLKITLPKSWKKGPASNLLDQFVESYNAKFVETNPLTASTLHLGIKEQQQEQQYAYGSMAGTAAATGVAETKIIPICNDDIVIDTIPDRTDVYICHGPGKTKAEVQAEKDAAQAKLEEHKKNTVACTRFGCQKRFPKGGPYPECVHHKLPPVFHETAKYWACCPNKKAYDWDDFQRIPGCMTGRCTDVKEIGKRFMGGTELREQANETKLKSIDDFNKEAQGSGTESGSPSAVIERLRNALFEVGIDKELFDQVIEGMKKEYEGSESEILSAVSEQLGSKLKAAMKGIAVDQLRLK